MSCLLAERVNGVTSTRRKVLMISLGGVLLISSSVHARVKAEKERKFSLPRQLSRLSLPSARFNGAAESTEHCYAGRFSLRRRCSIAVYAPHTFYNREWIRCERHARESTTNRSTLCKTTCARRWLTEIFEFPASDCTPVV